MTTSFHKRGQHHHHQSAMNLFRQIESNTLPEMKIVSTQVMFGKRKQTRRLEPEQNKLFTAITHAERGLGQTLDMRDIRDTRKL